MKISVITASYNYAQYIEEMINSIINQSYRDWELIIVDDGSSDNSVEIIKSYCQKDSHIKFFQHENGENKGLKETLLLGIEHATGDWIAFLESDDYYAADNLLKKAEIIQKHPEVKLIFNKVSFIWEKEIKTKTKEKFENTQKMLSKIEFPKNVFYKFDVDNIILTFSAVAVDAKTLKSVDFNTPVDSLMDWWLWIHLAYKNNFYYIDEELTHWRLHEKSYIRTSKRPLWYFLQTRAYDDVYFKNKTDFKLLLFVCIYRAKVFLIRGYRFVRNLVKGILNLN